MHALFPTAWKPTACSSVMFQYCMRRAASTGIATLLSTAQRGASVPVSRVLKHSLSSNAFNRAGRHAMCRQAQACTGAGLPKQDTKAHVRTHTVTNLAVMSFMNRIIQALSGWLFTSVPLEVSAVCSPASACLSQSRCRPASGQPLRRMKRAQPDAGAVVQVRQRSLWSLPLWAARAPAEVLLPHVAARDDALYAVCRVIV
jgi:hypothetical protein